MPGQVDFVAGSVPLSRPKALVAVFRNFGFGNFVYLPNVIAESVQERFGASPAVALLRYTADQYSQDGYPVRLDDAIPLDALNPSVVRPDDRIAIVAFDPLGTWRFLFDGFCKVPEAALSPNTERVSFQAIGVAEREWDTPLAGAWFRAGDTPQQTQSADSLTGIPARFNPDGLPNATPDGADATFPGSSFQAPSFLDPLLCRSLGIGRKWSLSMASRYVMAVGNVKQTYVQLPTWQSVDQLLDSWEPVNGQTIDPTNPSTYQINQIIIRDFTVTGKPWPAALDELIRPHGFAMRFEVVSSASGGPVTQLVLWKRDTGDGKRYKDVLLPSPGQGLDPAQVNLSHAHFARDGTEVANQVELETDLLHHEASFVLAPGWTPAAADISNKASFRIAGNPSFSSQRKEYRAFVFDETGEGHWDYTQSAWKTGTGTDLTKVLGLGSQDPANWVKRRRPGQQTLISRDATGLPLLATLAVSFDYGGPCPGVWNGTGTWRAIKGEWSLLKDRLGIWVSCNDPNAFSVGVTGSEQGRQGSQVLRLVEWIAGTPSVKIFLRLTCVIDGDQRATAMAPRRAASPSQFVITQHVDAKDRYEVELVSKWSEFSSSPGWTGATADTFGRDDTSDAVSEAYARQAALELPHLAGTLSIPRLSLAYQIGDRIPRIRGRDVSLQTNAAGTGSDPPTYTEIIGRTFRLVDQRTELLLSDQRTDES
ncbi:MAG TPA: hypothetical protein VGY53_12560 [Isosphaeraceae bacterium]|nr:hypothetical protein [Isosphaeraceae bacterium]